MVKLCGVPPRVGVMPVCAWNRAQITSQNAGDSSIPQHRRPVLCAAMIAVPEPANGS